MKRRVYPGANKRDAGVTSPLDLSSPGGFAPRKRQRAETRRSGSVSPKPKPTPRPTTPPPVRCPSLCGHMPCGDGQAVNRWTIEDVVNYVSSIDICAEYAQVSLLNTFTLCSCQTSFFSVPRNSELWVKLRVSRRSRRLTRQTNAGRLVFAEFRKKKRHRRCWNFAPWWQRCEPIEARIFSAERAVR